MLRLHFYYATTGRLSLRLNGHFPGGPRLADTRMFPFWILLELRMMEVVVTSGAIRRAKLQSNCHHQQTNTQLFTGWMAFLSPNQQCQSTEGKHNGTTVGVI